MFDRVVQNLSEIQNSSIAHVCAFDRIGEYVFAELEAQAEWDSADLVIGGLCSEAQVLLGLSNRRILSRARAVGRWSWRASTLSMPAPSPPSRNNSMLPLPSIQ